MRRGGGAVVNNRIVEEEEEEEEGCLDWAEVNRIELERLMRRKVQNLKRRLAKLQDVRGKPFYYNLQWPPLAATVRRRTVVIPLSSASGLKLGNGMDERRHMIKGFGWGERPSFAASPERRPESGGSSPTRRHDAAALLGQLSALVLFEINRAPGSWVLGG
ncbi:Fc.00g013710.m01.CDS01 [Cosmosporella sp. VM-42]